MKNTVVTASLIPVLALALATAAQFAGLVSFKPPTGRLRGGLAAAGVLTFAFVIENRRSAPASRHPAKAAPATNRTALPRARLDL